MEFFLLSDGTLFDGEMEFFLPHVPHVVVWWVVAGGGGWWWVVVVAERKEPSNIRLRNNKNSPPNLEITAPGLRPSAT